MRHESRRTLPTFASSLAAALACLMLGCGGSQTCRRGPADDVEMGARTGVEGAKTGATTAVEGVKTAGSAAAGWVEGGSAEARRRWNEGKQQTRGTAREGAADVDRAASVPECE